MQICQPCKFANQFPNYELRTQPNLIWPNQPSTATANNEFNEFVVGELVGELD